MAMQRMDDALAFADIIALAALADGVVTDSELRTIGYALEEFTEGAVTVHDCMERWNTLIAEHDSLNKLTLYVQYSVERLSPADRDAAWAVISGLAADGSGLIDPRLAGYRNTYRASPDALLAMFRDALHTTTD